MRLLLDTHTLIWWLAGSDQLAPPAVDALGDPATTAVVSAATFWEIEIKRALGKLDSPADAIGQAAASGFHQLSMTAEHAVAAGRLPRHHDDPFDRMLIAQALSEGLTVVTRDRRFARYDVQVLAA